MRTSMAFCWIPAVLLLAGAAYGDPPQPQEPGPWKYGLVAGINLSQSTFSSNWSGGDKGAILWVVSSDATAERQFSRTFNLSNLLQLAYGQTSKQTPDSNGNLRWDPPDKTTDRIAFESVGRFTLRSFVDPYVSLRLDSQFLDQSNPLGDIHFNPIKLKEAAGVARVLHKTEEAEAITRVGFGFRQTLGRTILPSTLSKQSFTSNDGGIEWETNVTQPVLHKQVLYKGQLLLFLPVFYSKSGALSDFDAQARAADPSRESVADFWKAHDLNFQNTFTAAITKNLAVNLFAQLVYDKFDTAADIDPSHALADQIAEIDRNVRKAGQFKEVLSLALSYRLF